MSRPLRFFFLVAIPIVLPHITLAQPTCDGPEHRQFDFWVGEWQVRDPSGQVIGTNAITRSYDGCLLIERWEGASGERGGCRGRPRAAPPPGD